MKSTDAAYTDSIPALYDEFLVPFLFKEYAADLARRLHGLESGHVLETAAGTGVVTQALRAALPNAVRITATDLNQGMLDVAARKELPGVRFQQADALELPFDDAAFDAVVAQFGVMFFPDKPQAFRETFRVLKSGGRFLFNVTAFERVTAATARAMAARFGDGPIDAKMQAIVFSAKR